MGGDEACGLVPRALPARAARVPLLRLLRTAHLARGRHGLRVGGTLTGQYDDLGEGDLVGNFGGQDLFITYGGGDGNDVALFTNAVPEPTTVLIWSMLAGVGMTVRRRR